MTDPEIVYSIGKRGNLATAERLGPRMYLVRYNGRAVKRRFESLSGASGYARHIWNQADTGDQFRHVADLEYFEPAKPGPMGPDEYRALLSRLHIHIEHVPEYIGASRRTAYRYGSEPGSIPAPIAILLRVVEESSFDLQRLKQIAEEETKGGST